MSDHKTMTPPPDQLTERARKRDIPVPDWQLTEIIAADDRYYRPLFGSDVAAAMATELLKLRREARS